MTIQDEIRKVINSIKIEEFRKKVLKKRSWLRKLETDIDPHYWENLKNQLTEPLAKELVDIVKELGNQVVEYDERIDQILELLGYQEKSPDFVGVIKDAAKPNEKTYWTNLAKEYARSARDNDNWRDLLDLIDVVVNTKQHLGISDLELDSLTSAAYLAMPVKKVNGIDTKLTLKELINFYNSFLPALQKRGSTEKLLDEANRYRELNITTNDEIREQGEITQTKIDTLKSAAQAESELIKTSELLETRTQEKNQLQTELEDKKEEITRLKAELEKLKNHDQQIAKKTIQNFKDMARELRISIPETKLQALENATSVEVLEKISKEIWATELTKNKKAAQQAHYLSIVLGILLAGSWLLLAGIAIKKNSRVKSRKRKPENKKMPTE